MNTSQTAPTSRARGKSRTALTLVELALAVALVLLDLLLPAVLLLVLAGLSLAIRRERPRSLGLLPLRPLGRSTWEIACWTVAWTALQLTLLMPLAEHATGERQDVSAFAEIEGDLGLWLLLLAAGWLLGALIEELAFRGYVLTRAAALFPARYAVLGGSVVAAVLFGLIHTEQGLVGVVLTTVDGLFFAWLRARYGSIWAAVLAHGMGNTIGLTAYFLVGPIYALW